MLILTGSTIPVTYPVTAANPWPTGMATSGLSVFFSLAGGSWTAAANNGNFVAANGQVGLFEQVWSSADLTATGALVLYATDGTYYWVSEQQDQVVAFDPTNATNLGLGALPDATAGASDGLVINGSNSGRIIWNNGMYISGDSGVGALVLQNGSATGAPVIQIYQPTANAPAVRLYVGSGTGDALQLIGGTSGGDGINVSTGAGIGINVAPGGANMDAVKLAPTGTGWGIDGTLSGAGGGGGPTPILTGTATAGSSTTIALASGSSTDGFYVGCRIDITSGTGAGQSRTITGWVHSTLVATVDRAWAITPDNTSVYAVQYSEGPALDAGLNVGGLSSTALAAIAAAILGATSETGLTVQDSLKVLTTFAAGLSNGMGTGSVNFRDQANTLNRITGTQDKSGNRTAVTLDLS